jgi:hypothetical protein
VPTVAAGIVEGLKVITGQICKLQVILPVQLLLSVTVMVINVPAPFDVVGVPDNTPAVLKESPVGKVPPVTANV